MNNPGNSITYLALVSVSVSFLLYLLQSFPFFTRNIGERRRIAVTFAARTGLILFTTAMLVASALMVYYLVSCAFQFSYVAEHTSRDLPLHFRISAFWAGQSGSFLLWVLISSILSTILMFTSGKNESCLMSVNTAVLLFLTAILIKQNPFKLLPIVRQDGLGMNIILKNFWMMIHPPTLFLGYAMMQIPFSFSIVALWKKNYIDWLQTSRIWIILAFVTLGAGIVIGGYWAYEVLGWGGYWGWDPIENASILPWFTTIALLHTMVLHLRKKRFIVTTYFLTAFSFLLVLYSTFVTRSGLLSNFSVHSFSDFGLVSPLLIFLVTFFILFHTLIIYRFHDITLEFKQVKSRSFSPDDYLICLTLILFVLLVIIIGFGLSYPILSGFFGNASNVDTGFYVKSTMPIGVLLAACLAYFSFFIWSKRHTATVRFQILSFITLSALFAFGMAVFKGTVGFKLLFSFSFIAAAVFFVTSISEGYKKKFVFLGSHLLHFGTALFFCGLAYSSSGESVNRVTVFEGKTEEVSGFNVTFKKASVKPTDNKMHITFYVDVKDKNTTYSLFPTMLLFMDKFEKRQRFAQPIIRRRLLSDLYMSIAGYNLNEHPSASPTRLVLSQGKSDIVDDITITFKGFKVEKHIVDKPKMSVRVLLSVKNKDREPIEVAPLVTVDRTLTSSRERLPCEKEMYVYIGSMSADDKTITVMVESAENKPEVAKSVILDISKKPGMSLLHLGLFFIIVGTGLVAFKPILKNNIYGEIE